MISTLSKSLQQMANKTEYAETTTSEYYTIGCIKVRISDHMACNIDSDLAIFDNGKSTYVVVPMIGTYKQVQWFTKVSEVTEFIIQFEKFAKLLVKPIVTTMKEEVKEKKQEIKKNATINVDYATWKSQFKNMYVEHNGVLASLLDQLFQKRPETFTYLKETVGSMQHVHKITAINKLLDA